MLAYRLALSLAVPLLAAFWLVRWLRGRERLEDLRERLGLGGPERAPDGPVLWLHGASVGELTAARPVAEALLARHGALRLLVTCNSTTGRAAGRGWNLPRTRVRLAPVDLRWAVGPVLARHGVTALAIVENELWPNRLALAARAGLPVGLVAARLSARSAARWGRLEWLARPLLARIALAAPQDAASAERLLSLGLPPAALGPETVLKAAVALPVPPAGEVAALGFDRAETVLAASTHAGEESPVLAAFARARATRPGLRLILAPRHPERSAEIARRIAAAGLAHATRSAGEAPNGGASGRASSGREAPGSEAPGQLSRQQPSPGQGSPRRVSTEEESPGQRSAGQASGQASAGQASTGQASTGQGSAGQAPTGQASPDQGSAGQGSAGQASTGRVSAGQGSAGQGSAGRLSTGGAAPVYLADTLGEMPLWYAAAGICFVGGSLVPKGGHTPFEPAQFGCAILHGPHIANAADAYGRLAEAGAAIEVATEDALADALVTLDATAQARLARAARAALAPADLRPLLDAIDARLLRLPPDRAE